MYLAIDNTAAERRADTPLGGLNSFQHVDRHPVAERLAHHPRLGNQSGGCASSRKWDRQKDKSGGGHDKEGEANPQEEQKMWRGARERHMRICEERRDEEGGALRRHRRWGRLVAQPTRQWRRDSHGEGLKRKQHRGVLRRHSVLLLITID